MPREAPAFNDRAESIDRHGLLKNRHSNPTRLSRGPIIAYELVQPPSNDSETQNLDTDDDKQDDNKSCVNGRPHSARNSTNESKSIRSPIPNDVGELFESKICGVWQYLDDS